MRPSTVLQAVEFAAQLARGSTLRRISTSDVGSRKRTRGFRPRSVSVVTLKCWNFGDAGHTSQGCSKPRDETSVARNTKELRARGKKRRIVGAVQRKRERRRLARIVLSVGEVQLRCLLLRVSVYPLCSPKSMRASSKNNHPSSGVTVLTMSSTVAGTRDKASGKIINFPGLYLRLKSKL